MPEKTKFLEMAPRKTPKASPLSRTPAPSVSPSGFGLASIQGAAGNMAMQRAACEDALVRSESALNFLSLDNQSMQRASSGGAPAAPANPIITGVGLASGGISSSRIEAEAYLPRAADWAERETASMVGSKLDLSARAQVGRHTDLAGTRTTVFESEAVAADKAGGVRTATRISLTEQDEASGGAFSDLPGLFSTYPIEVAYRRITYYLDQEGRQLQVSVTGTLFFTHGQWALGGPLMAAADFGRLLDKRANAGTYVVGVSGRDRAGTFTVTLTGANASLREQFESASAALIGALARGQAGQPGTELLTQFLAPGASTGEQHAAIQRFFATTAPEREVLLRALDDELAADVETTKDKLLEERIDADDERQLFDIAAKWAARRDAQTPSGRTYFDEYLARLRASSWVRDYFFFEGSSTNYLDSLFDEVEERHGELLTLVARNSREYGDYLPTWDPAAMKGAAPNETLVKRAADQVLLGLKMRTSSDDVRIIVDTMTGLSGPTQAAVLKEIMSRYDERNWIGLGRYGEAEPEGMLYYLFEDLDSDGRKRLGKSLVENGVLDQGAVDVLSEGRTWAGRNMPWTTTKARQSTEFWAKKAVEEDSKFAMVMGSLSSLWLPETAASTITTLAGARILPEIAKVHPYVEGSMLVVGTGLSSYQVGIHLQEVVTGKDPYSGRELTDEEMIASRLLLFSSSLFLTAGFMQAPQTQQRIFTHRAPNLGPLPPGWKAGKLEIDAFTRPGQRLSEPFAEQGKQLIYHPKSGEVIEIRGAAGAYEFTVTRLATGDQIFIGRGGAIRVPGPALGSGGAPVGGGATPPAPPSPAPGGSTVTDVAPSTGTPGAVVRVPAARPGSTAAQQPPRSHVGTPGTVLAPQVTGPSAPAGGAKKQVTTPPSPRALPPGVDPKAKLTADILKDIEDSMGPQDAPAPTELDPKEFGPVPRPVVSSLGEVDISDIPADVKARYLVRYPAYAKEYLAKGKPPPLRTFQDYMRFRYGKLTHQLPATPKAGGGEGMSIESRLGIEQGHLAEQLQVRLRNTVKNTREYEVRFIDPVRGVAVIKTVIPDFMPTARTNDAGQYLSATRTDEALLIADSKMTWEEGNVAIDNQIRAMIVLARRNGVPFVFLVGQGRGISAGIQEFATAVGAEIYVVQDESGLLK